MATTEYSGIDYGMGKVNIDRESGIRFGVINQNEVLQAWGEDSEAIYPCEDCEFSQGDDDCGCCDCDPIGFVYSDGGYQAESGSDGDIFITKSPFFTFAQFCSPCAPGACYLMNPLDEPWSNNKCYCFGHDWFYDSDNECAPYPVYEVATGKRVLPPVK